MLRLTRASIVLGGVLSTAPGAEFDLSLHSIDGGGVLHSSGGAFNLSGTIGQPDAGTLSGALFSSPAAFGSKLRCRTATRTAR